MDTLPGLTKERFQERLIELGARTFCEMGLYYAPSRTAVPLISCLPVIKGFMCSNCPNGTSRVTAYFSGKETTMKKHIQMVHHGLPSNSYVSSYVQAIFSNLRYKTFFGVEKVYVGKCIPSTITDEGSSMFKQFTKSTLFQEHVKDVKVLEEKNSNASTIPRFYKEVNWFGLVNAIAGEDTAQNRVKLYNWLTLTTTEDNELYRDIHTWTNSYFQRIQNILSDSLRDDYLLRIKMMCTTR